MVSDGNYVYFRKDDGLYRASTTTRASATLIANVVGLVSDLAIGNGVLYWLDIGKGTDDGSLNQLAL